MLIPILFGSFLIAICVILQALGSVYWIKRFRSIIVVNKKFSLHYALWLLTFSFIFFTLLHTIQTAVWAFGYYLHPEITTTFTGFTEALYFSMVTFTTLGYGDIVLPDNWRILSGLEAVNGIMLIGWTSAIMFALIQNIYKKIIQ